MESYSAACINKVLEYVYAGIQSCTDEKLHTNFSDVSKIFKEWGLVLPKTDSVPQQIVENQNQECTPPTGTQCLDALIHCIEDAEKNKECEESSDHSSEHEKDDNYSDDKNNSDEQDENEDEDDEEWSEMVEFMTQRKRSEITMNQSTIEHELVEGQIDQIDYNELDKSDSLKTNEEITETVFDEDPVESVPVMTTQTSTILNRSSSPDMFDMSDNEDVIDNVTSKTIEVNTNISPSYDDHENIDVGSKRKTISQSSMSGNRSKRLCFENHEDCLSLGENNKHEKDNQDELIDLTNNSYSSF